MPRFHNCEICGAYAVTESHRCPPIFLCIDLENEREDWDDAWKIHAYEADRAAEKAAEKMDDDGDGPSEREISVKDPEGNITKWSISFDYSVDYSATKVKE